mgnify:CR=1 FL=1
MRVGVGGRAGPVRAGVSNRGVGAGVGPVSVGSSFNGGCGELIGWAFAVVVLGYVAYLAAAWPFLIGSWLAVKLGAADPSAARSAAGWVAELLYVAAIIWALTSGIRARRRVLRSAQRRAEADRLSGFQSQLSAAVDGVRRSVQAGRPVVFTLPDVQLIGPDRGRGAPTALETGQLRLNDVSARFVGNNRSAEWTWTSVTSWDYNDEYLAIGVSGRDAVLGVRSSTGLDDALLICMEWLRPGGTMGSASSALADLESLLNDVVAARADLMRTR